MLTWDKGISFCFFAAGGPSESSLSVLTRDGLRAAFAFCELDVCEGILGDGREKGG